MNAIEVKNITKIYRKGVRGVKVPAVTDLSFSVNKGTITGFVGPNGAGKTTTIKMITGLAFPTAGNIHINGKDASEVKSRAGVAYLSEQPYFYTHLTVTEMLRFTAHLIELPPSSISGEIGRVLQLVEMAHKKDAKIKELSKGMQQRINMASTLLGSPTTLILDEPMSGMDPPGRRLFRKLIAQLHEEGSTLFFSTHVLEDIETLCDDVVVLQEGKLVYSGEVAALIEQGFIGIEMNTGKLEEPVRKELEEMGCTLTDRGAGNDWVVMVPKNRDPSRVQQYLYRHDCFPQSISRRSMTLETLLYQQKPGSPA
jgi:ABC-2 type transport system ATP-binding protein